MIAAAIALSAFIRGAGFQISGKVIEGHRPSVRQMDILPYEIKTSICRFEKSQQLWASSATLAPKGLISSFLWTATYELEGREGVTLIRRTLPSWISFLKTGSNVKVIPMPAMTSAI